MPTYEYACKGCGEHIEVVQSFSDDPLTTCPGCRGDLRKVFGSIGIAFKGSGFYKTDSRSSTKTTTSSETKTETKSKTKSDTKSDSSGAGSKSDSGSSSAGAAGSAAS